MTAQLQHLAERVRWLGPKPARDARSALYGPAYVAALDRITERVPADGWYTLVDRRESLDDVDLQIVRLELTPRRAYLLTRDSPPPAAVELAMPAVVVRSRRPPLLVDRSYVHSGRPSLAGTADGRLRSSVTRILDGPRQRGSLVVEGWCQEDTGLPCHGIRFWVDGEERAPALLVRHEGPEEGGRMPGAGFRAVLLRGGDPPGARELLVAFFTSEARYALHPPRRFVWVP